MKLHITWKNGLPLQQEAMSTRRKRIYTVVDSHPIRLMELIVMLDSISPLIQIPEEAGKVS